MVKNAVLTVSQLNRYVKSKLEENPLLSDILIKGEISNFTRHYSSGHLYFSLKDTSASVKAVMFKSYADAVKFDPRNGMAVLVRCAATIYERDGAYQLYIYEMQPDGIGALYMAFEQLKEKLRQKGMFDSERKKAIPRLPAAIGVVTSESGAALQDILTVLRRRSPFVKVVLCPVNVQGEDAAPSMVQAVAALNAQKSCDVIIIGRGGGSIEDLWAFNDERLAQAIYSSDIPVISAVGHEVDFTICDFVADVRAPTPTAAAQMVAPDISDLREMLSEQGAGIKTAMQGKLYQIASRFDAAEKVCAAFSPVAVVCAQIGRISELSRRVGAAVRRAIENRRQRLMAAARLVDLLSPLNVLLRGYTITKLDGKIVGVSADIKAGDIISTYTPRHEIISRVEAVRGGELFE